MITRSAEAIALGSALALGTVFIGYPCAIAVRARITPKPYPQGAQILRGRAPKDLPTVAILLVAHNEATRLPGKLATLQALEYPADKLRFFIADDASTDDTAHVLQQLQAQEPRLTVHRADRNMGKPDNLNRLVELVDQTGGADVLVFNDARQNLAPEALLALLAPLEDPKVGGATGDLVLPPKPDGTLRGMGAYWRYETWIRRNEALTGSVVGATGALYAVRRTCFTPFEPELVLDDMLLPLRVVLQGHRFVFASQAQAYDVYSRDLDHELTRKARTLGGVYQAMALEPGLLDASTEVFVPFLFHKLGRLALPWLLDGMALGNGVALVGLTLQGKLLGPRGALQLGLAAAQLTWNFSKHIAATREAQGRNAGPLAAARTLDTLQKASRQGWRMWRNGDVHAAWGSKETRPGDEAAL